jgi:hypothetical protein
MTLAVAVVALRREQLGTHHSGALFLGCPQEVIVRALDASGGTEGAERVHCYRSSSFVTHITVVMNQYQFFAKREVLFKCINSWIYPRKLQ